MGLEKKIGPRPIHSVGGGDDVGVGLYLDVPLHTANLPSTLSILSRIFVVVVEFSNWLLDESLLEFSNSSRIFNVEQS